MEDRIGWVILGIIIFLFVLIIYPKIKANSCQDKNVTFICCPVYTNFKESCYNSDLNTSLKYEDWNKNCISSNRSFKKINICNGEVFKISSTYTNGILTNVR